MTNRQAQPGVAIHIKTPCPKTWDQLEGGEKRRFCSECSLHVLDAARFTRREALELVGNASERVCMRMQYDSSGAPVFRDSRPTLAARARRWALTAAAGLLAACHRAVPECAPKDPALISDPIVNSTLLGRVAPVERMGDVALPLPTPPEMLGEVVLPATPQVSGRELPRDK